MKQKLKGLMAALAMAASTGVHADEVPDLVTIVTSPEPQTQLMAMVLTMNAAQKGAKAHILLCGPGGDMALQDAPESVLAPQAPKSMSSQGLMKIILEKGLATAEVCAIYLPNAKLSPDALLDGIGVADPAVMAARIIADDARVMSF